MAVQQASAEVARYRAIVSTYDKAVERWHRRGKDIVKRYADDRGDTDSTKARYNVLWSNVETLKPFLYSQTPKPVAQRRFKDADPVARVAAEVIERALAFTLQEAHFGSALRNARDDYLLPGRGTAWVRYVPQFEAQAVQVDDAAEATADATTEAEVAEVEADAPEPKVAFEKVIADYVHWKDFGHTIARIWEEVDCVWRWVRMSRKALIERFPEHGAKVPLDCPANESRQGGSKTESADDTALVCELWCRTKRRAYWFTKAYPEMLDEREDPLGLDEFFPCPRPIYATLTTDSLIPIPDYVEYQDQANELDDLTARINALTAAIKAAGVYDQSVPALRELLKDGHDNELIPVENWAALSEKGGLRGAVEMLPMADVAQTLIQLYDARERVKADLYEITGMSDIIRGNTAPDETATAQKIKSNFATKRLAERQAEVARFAGNLVAIMGNVIARTFSADTLVAMTGIKLLWDDEKQALQAWQGQNPQTQAPVPGQAPPPFPEGMTPQEVSDAMAQPSWDQVFELLHNDPERRFRIDIETDTLVAPDNAEEQQETVQFFQAIGGYLAQAVQASEAQPELAPLLGKMLLFGVRRFSIARDLESSFEQALDALEAQSKQPPQPKPDPVMAKVNGELQLARERQQFEQTQAQAEAQHRQRMEIATAQQAQANTSAAQQMEVFKAHLQASSDAAQSRLDAALAQQAADMKAHTDILIARINAFAKIEAAGEAKGATHDTAAEAHEQAGGA